MKVRWIAIIALLVSGCASKPSKSVRQQEIPTEDSRVSDFDKGLRALELENYVAAAEIFDRILVQKPATEMDLVIQYNAGAAYEGMGNCSKALDRYRGVVRSSSGKFGRIEGEALFRSSLMYECLEQDAKAVTALLDAKKRGKELPFEVQVAEVPARLATAYARLGNREKAIFYFNQASRGLKRVVSMEGRSSQLERVSKTLFLMGKLNPTQKSADVNPTTYLRSISMQQPYLLQAIEMGHPVWSKRASQDLRIAYENVWRFSIPAERERRQFLMQVMQSIHELKKIRMPKSSPPVDEIFALLDKTEVRIQNELAQFAPDNPLTGEAEKRQGLRQEGRLVNPEPAKKKSEKWKK